MNGQHIRMLETNRKNSGTYSISWDGFDDRGRTVPGGVYFYRLTIGDQVITRQCVLVR